MLAIEAGAWLKSPSARRHGNRRLFNTRREPRRDDKWRPSPASDFHGFSPQPHRRRHDLPARESERYDARLLATVTNRVRAEAYSRQALFRIIVMLYQ